MPPLNLFLIVLGVLIGIVGLITLGFILRPRPFRPHPVPSHINETVTLRPDLPEPVLRHFRETIGETPAQVTSAVAWGRGSACIRGVWMPLRFRSWYRPGTAFVRRTEMTWFMRPVMRWTDRYLHGAGESALSGEFESGQKVSQGMALAMWAENIWMPVVLAQDPRLEWQPVDEHAARLLVPVPGGSSELVAHFDPLTGRMTDLAGMRYSSQSGMEEPWRIDLLAWETFNDVLVPSQVAVAWGESGSPWIYWMLDGIVYNVDVADQLGQVGEV